MASPPIEPPAVHKGAPPPRESPPALTPRPPVQDKPDEFAWSPPVKPSGLHLFLQAVEPEEPPAVESKYEAPELTDEERLRRMRLRDEEQEEQAWARLRRRLRGFHRFLIASLVVHIVVLVVLSWQKTPDLSPDYITLTIQTPSHELNPPEPVLTPVEPVEYDEIEGAPEAESDTDSPHHETSRAGGVALATEFIGKLPTGAGVVGFEGIDNAGDLLPGRGGSGGGGGRGGGKLREKEEKKEDQAPPEAEFFGTKAQGKRFVFVVDASKSMVGPRFTRACFETLAAIERLQENQEFHVFFFNRDTFAMMKRKGDRTIVATDVNKRRFENWLDGTHKLLPGTQPTDAMIRALKMEPDAIFLLSDGKFTDGCYPVLMRYPDTSIPIHTIALGTRDYELPMQDIAARFGGTYRFVE